MKTYVAIILDNSGSMKRTKLQAMQSFNEQVQQMKINAKEGQEIIASLITFNGNVYEHLWGESVEKVNELTEKEYQPDGGTAMRDAVGYTIQKYMDTTDYKNKDNAYLLIVISDGETNVDKLYSISALRELTDFTTSADNWTITYMGCSESYLKQVSLETGIPVSNMAAFSNNSAKDYEYANSQLRARTAKYFNARSKGLSVSCNYMSDDNKVADFNVNAENNFNVNVTNLNENLNNDNQKALKSFLKKNVNDLDVVKPH